VSAKPTIKEGDRVRTAQGEPATVYMLHPTEPVCVLEMADQFMPDGGAALRTVETSSLTKERGV
jgi:hypothetical protein